MEGKENYKQIGEDLTTGKNHILDYHNNKLECTKLGAEKPKYYLNITGYHSFNSRLKKGLINEIKYGSTQYLPIYTRFLGSTMYPRPFAIPFVNQKDFKEKILLDEIRKEGLYNLPKNKEFLLKEKIKNDLPNYFCVKLAMDNPKGKKRLIDFISKEIDNRKKKFNNQAKYYKKDSVFKGLTQHKNEFENNLTKDMLNGEKIPIINQKDLNNKFKVIKRLIKKNRLNIEKEEINKEEYNKLYKIKKIQEMTQNKFFNGNNFSNLTNTNLNLSMNEIMKRKNDNQLKKVHSFYSPTNSRINIKQKRRQRMTNNLDSSNNNVSNDVKYKSFQNTTNKSIKFNSTITTCYYYNSDITSNNINNESKLSIKNYQTTSKNEIYTPKSLYKLKRSLSDFQPNFMNSKEDEEININNINNISVMNEKNKKIKNLKDMEKYYERETKLMKGYQPPLNNESNEEPKKYKPPNYISPVAIYKRETEMLIKVNPIEYEKEMKKKLIDEQFLRKKLQNKKIFERIKTKK